MRVFVLGNATLDAVQDIARLPLPGETLLCERLYRCAGGKGLNQAIACARTGAATVLVAPVGEDSDGLVLKAAATGQPGLETRWIPSDCATDYSAIWVAADGENAIVSSAFAAHGLRLDDALAGLNDMAGGDILLMQGNLTAPVTEAAADLARSRGARRVLNTAPIAWDMASILPMFDIVIANAVEANALAGGAKGHEEGATWLGNQAGGTAIVTRGPAGAILVQAGQIAVVPAPKVQAVDTSGAGDVLAGVLTGLLAQGEALAVALQTAVAAAAITVTRRGTTPAFPSTKEIAALRAEM